MIKWYTALQHQKDRGADTVSVGGLDTAHFFQLRSKTQILYLTSTRLDQCFKSINHFSLLLILPLWATSGCNGKGSFIHTILLGLWKQCPHAWLCSPQQVSLLKGSRVFQLLHGSHASSSLRGLHHCPDTAYLVSTLPRSPSFSHCYHNARATTSLTPLIRN